MILYLHTKDSNNEVVATTTHTNQPQLHTQINYNDLVVQKPRRTRKLSSQLDTSIRKRDRERERLKNKKKHFEELNHELTLKNLEYARLLKLVRYLHQQVKQG